MSDGAYLEVRTFFEKVIEKESRAMAGEVIWDHATEERRAVFREAARLAIWLHLTVMVGGGEK